MSHPLEEKYQLIADQILEVIARSPRCEQMVKGFVAEYHFELLLTDLKDREVIQDFQRIDKDGQPDFQVHVDGQMHLVEVKLFMTTGGTNSRYKVDFQRTRNAKDDKRSRSYRRSDFDILAACTYNKNGRWDFQFIRTSDLPLDEKMGEDCLKKAVYYEKSDTHWVSRFETVLGADKERGGVTTDTVSLDRYT